jgi:hypothetical protein
MIDDTVKELLRAARYAKTLDECRALRERANTELDTRVGVGFACLVAIRVREDAIIDQYKFDIASEAP